MDTRRHQRSNYVPPFQLECNNSVFHCESRPKHQKLVNKTPSDGVDVNKDIGALMNSSVLSCTSNWPLILRHVTSWYLKLLSKNAWRERKLNVRLVHVIMYILHRREHYCFRRIFRHQHNKYLWRDFEIFIEIAACCLPYNLQACDLFCKSYFK